MYLYEAISCRRSVRRYLHREVPEEIRRQIVRFFDASSRLDENLRVSAVITDERGSKDRKSGAPGILSRKHLPVPGEPQVPYLLTVYSSEGPDMAENAGCMLEQVSLYLACKGIGSCILGSVPLAGLAIDDRKAVIAMGFGYPDGKLTRDSLLAHRLPLGTLCVFRTEPGESMKKLLRAARLSPSALNCQPWRFEVFGNKMRIFERHTAKSALAGQRMRAVSMGCMLGNVLVASDELWLHPSFEQESRAMRGESPELKGAEYWMTISFRQ